MFYELIPVDGRKSFYGKARVYRSTDGTETLYSYNTAVLRRDPSGRLVRLWMGWSLTTGRHIRAFCGLDKSGYCAMPLAADDGRTVCNC